MMTCFILMSRFGVKMARVSKHAKRLALSKKKHRIFQCLFQFKLSFQSRLVLASKTINLSKEIAKVERKPRRKVRKRSTEWFERDVPAMDTTEFRRNFRLSRAAFRKLVDRLEPILRKEETFAKNTIPAERKVAMTLYFLGQGVNYLAVGNLFGAAVSTVCVAVKETVKAIVQNLTPELICFPSSEADLVAATNSFGNKFPNCVGAIDGTHVPIKRPNKYGTNYYNRKGYYSLLMQGVCDGNGKFCSVSCGYPGSIHDARMLRMSSFYEGVIEKRYVCLRLRAIVNS